MQGQIPQKKQCLSSVKPDETQSETVIIPADLADLQLIGVNKNSPLWSANTKLLVGLIMAALVIFLIFRFLNLLGPLMIAFLFAYLFFPIAQTVQRATRMPWRLSVTLIYLIVIIVLLGSLAAGGLAVVDQVTSLINFLQKAITTLPATIDTFLSTPLVIGPFEFQPNALNMDVNTITQQVSGVVQPLLSGAGVLVTTFAGRAAEVVGWSFFILLISYFMLAESGRFPNILTNLGLPGYAQDLKRLNDELSRIWNAFLRGQLTIVMLTILIYTFWLGGLRVNFFFGLALLAGVARFVPYVGPFIAWTTYGLVAFFQGYTVFGLTPIGYAALIVISAWLIDMTIDNFVVPRLMADALRVHPAAVMVFALVGANLLGLIGVVLAAPVLATIQLFFGYIIRKLFDQDPFAEMQIIGPPNPLPFRSVPGKAKGAWSRLTSGLFKQK